MYTCGSFVPVMRLVNRNAAHVAARDVAASAKLVPIRFAPMTDGAKALQVG